METVSGVVLDTATMKESFAKVALANPSQKRRCSLEHLLELEYHSGEEPCYTLTGYNTCYLCLSSPEISPSDQSCQYNNDKPGPQALPSCIYYRGIVSCYDHMRPIEGVGG